VDPLERIAEEAAAESPVWQGAVLPSDERQLVAVFSALALDRYAVGLETVYEAYLVHYGRPRLFGVPEESERVLLGDYLYAHGLVRIAAAGGVDAVAAMAELISECAALRAAGRPGDGDAWIEAARSLGGTPADAEIEQALERHVGRVATAPACD
jgi:hypothetical protein